MTTGGWREPWQVVQWREARKELLLRELEGISVSGDVEETLEWLATWDCETVVRVAELLRLARRRTPRRRTSVGA